MPSSGCQRASGRVPGRQSDHWRSMRCATPSHEQLANLPRPVFGPDSIGSLRQMAGSWFVEKRGARVSVKELQGSLHVVCLGPFRLTGTQQPWAGQTFRDMPRLGGRPACMGWRAALPGPRCHTRRQTGDAAPLRPHGTADARSVGEHGRPAFCAPVARLGVCVPVREETLYGPGRCAVHRRAFPKNRRTVAVRSLPGRGDRCAPEVLTWGP